MSPTLNYTAWTVNSRLDIIASFLTSDSKPEARYTVFLGNEKQPRHSALLRAGEVITEVVGFGQDLFGAATDPDDDLSFWVISRYPVSVDNWKAIVGKVSP